MKHMECEDCKLRNGDCGHHFKMYGNTNYDIPSLTACDRYGNCEFFQQKERPHGDLISREALKKKLEEMANNEWNIQVGSSKGLEDAIDVVDNAPTVVPEKPKGEWARHDEWVNGEYVGGFYHVNCPVIEEGYALYSRWTTRFCPNCGAPMLKGDPE